MTVETKTNDSFLFMEYVYALLDNKYVCALLDNKYVCALLDMFLFFITLLVLYYMKNKIYQFKNNRCMAICYDIFQIIFNPVIIYIIVKFILYNNSYVAYIFEYLMVDNANGENNDIEAVYLLFINVMFKLSHIIKLFCILLTLHNIIIYVIQKKTDPLLSKHKELALKSILKMVEFVIMSFFLILLLYVANVDIKTIVTTTITPLAAIMYFLKNKINSILNGAIFILSNTYKKNDFIFIKQLNIIGFIEDITLSHVHIQTSEQNIVTVPINTFLENNIEIRNNEEELYIVVNASISFQEDTITIDKIIDAFAKGNNIEEKKYISPTSVIINTIQTDNITLTLHYSVPIKTFKEYYSYKNNIYKSIYSTAIDNNCKCGSISEVK